VVLGNLFLSPDECVGPLIVSADEGIDVLLKLLDGRERCAAEQLALQDAGPNLELIEP
jgi:hypothetical protein